MEELTALLIPVLLGILLIRLLLRPIRLIFKLALYSAGGFLCLWLLNTASGFTGVYLPINAVTVLLSGILGIPGIGLIALPELAAR